MNPAVNRGLGDWSHNFVNRRELDSKTRFDYPTVGSLAVNRDLSDWRRDFINRRELGPGARC